VTVGPGTTGSPYDATTFLHVKGTTRSIVQQSSTADAYYMFGDAAANNVAWLGYNHSTNQLSLHTSGTTYIDGNTTFAGNLGTGGLTATDVTGLSIKSQSISSQQSAIDIIQNGSGTDPIIRMGEKSTNGARLHMFDSNVEKIAFYTDGTNPDGGGGAGEGGSLTVEGRRDGTANLISLRARDASAPTVALPDGQGGLIRWQGFDGTDFAQMGAISVVADGQAVANSDAPSKMIFYTTPDGSDALTTALTLDKSQNATFAGTLSLGGGDSTTAQLALKGQQSLLSFIRGTSGDAQFFMSSDSARLYFSHTDIQSTNLILTLNTDKSATFAGDITQSDGKRIWFRNSSASSATGAQSYIHSDGLNLKIKGDDNVRILGDGGGTIAHFDYTGKVGIGIESGLAGLLHVKGSGDAIRVESTNTGAGGAQIDLLHFTTFTSR
jgi:hypothetical protein